MVYLDHAASTDLRPQVREAWLAAAEGTANPASLHRSGRSARRTVEESRERIAAALQVPAATLTFTSGGTESDNIAVTGTFLGRREVDPDRGLIVLPRTEHKAVLEPAAALGPGRLLWLGCDADGQVAPDDVKAALADHPGEVALVSVMTVNNEVGTIAPVAEMAAIASGFDVPFHTDAVQALGTVPLDLTDVSLASFSAHKLGGPMGVGLLYVRPGTPVAPLTRGGGHESGIRSGTLNVPGIAATAVAVELAVAEQDAHAAHQARLRHQLLAGLAAIPDLGYSLNSAPQGVPGIVNVAFPGCESDALMMLLDSAGVSVSTGSACTVGIPQPSHVLVAMGRSSADARSALRISTGRSTTDVDIDALLQALPEAVARARRAGMVSRRVSS